VNDSDPRYDDTDVEITDLDEPGAPARSHQRLSRLASIPFERRYRRPMTFVSIAFGLLSVIVMLIIIVPVRPALSGPDDVLITQPTEQSKFMYAVQASPPWGHLLVDGHSAGFELPQGSLELILARGRHVLTWIAPPFASQQCTLFVPAGNEGDTCNHQATTVERQGVTDGFIAFHASLSLLPPDLGAALVRAVQHALDLQQSSETVQPGEVYAISSLAFPIVTKPCFQVQGQGSALCYQPTRQPLRATVSFQLDTDTSSSAPCTEGECTYYGQDCRLFCDAPDATFSSMPGTWDIFAIAHSIWLYRTAQRQLIVPPETDSFIWGQQDEHVIPFSVGWDGAAWHVTTDIENAQSSLSNPMCDAASGDVGTLLDPIVSGGLSYDLFPAPSLAPCSCTVSAS